MSGGREVGVVVFLATLSVLAGACSDGEEHDVVHGGSSGTAGSSGAAGNAGSNGAGGSSGVGGSGGSADAGPLGDYLDRTAAAYCEAIFSCAELRKDFVLELLGGRERCPAVLKRILASEPRYAERMRQLAQGSLVLNNDALEACLGHQRSCLLAEREIFQPCREVFEGNVQRGGSCRFDDECAGDAYCSGAARTCPGSCAPRQPAGGTCRANGECAGRYARCVSDATTGARICRELTVVEGVAAAAPCGDTGPTELSVCRPELWCENESAGQGVCRELIPQGGACASDFEVCAGGHFCDGDVPTGSCQPVTVAREGQTCDVATLTFCDIYAGFFCVAGQCQATGTGGIGTQCGTDTFSCDVGLYCDRTNDTCQNRHAAGEPCSGAVQCSSGTCGSDSRCAATYCGL